MGERKKVTMQQIADKMNISKVTVSKALNNKDGVSNSLRQKIIEQANKLGYVSIKNTEKNVIKNIAVIVQEKFVNTDEYVTFYLRFYQKIAKRLNHYKYITNLITIDHKNTRRDDIQNILENSNVSGVIIMGYIKNNFIKTIKDLQIPIVFLDYYDANNSTNCIITDSYYSSYDITNYLLNMGHREIGFVGSVKSTSSIQDRFLGYWRAMLEKAISINNKYILEDRDNEGEEIDIILPNKLPTAFVCNCDDTAYKMVQVLKKANIHVPNDVSIVGFDNDFNSERCEPSLTTVAIDIDTMVKKATTFLLDIMEKNIDAHHSKVFVSGKIIYRDSVKNINK